MEKGKRGEENAGGYRVLNGNVGNTWAHLMYLVKGERAGELLHMVRAYGCGCTRYDLQAKPLLFCTMLSRFETAASVLTDQPPPNYTEAETQLPPKLSPYLFKPVYLPLCLNPLQAVSAE